MLEKIMVESAHKVSLGNVFNKKSGILNYTLPKNLRFDTHWASCDHL